MKKRGCWSVWLGALAGIAVAMQAATDASDSSPIPAPLADLDVFNKGSPFLRGA